MIRRLILGLFLNISGVDANLLVVLLKGSEILTSLRELTLLHTLADIPVYEGTLRVEEIELVVETAPGGRDGSGVGQHAHATGNLGQVTTGDVGGSLIADAELETGRAPVDELDGALGFDDADSSVDVLGDDVATVEQSTSHCWELSAYTISSFLRPDILYFPSLGSHLTIWFPASKQENVMSATEFCSW